MGVTIEPLGDVDTGWNVSELGAVDCVWKKLERGGIDGSLAIGSDSSRKGWYVKATRNR